MRFRAAYCRVDATPCEGPVLTRRPPAPPDGSPGGPPDGLRLPVGGVYAVPSSSRELVLLPGGSGHEHDGGGGALPSRQPPALPDPQCAARGQSLRPDAGGFQPLDSQLIVSLAILTAALRIWLRGGRDGHSSGTVVFDFAPAARVAMLVAYGGRPSQIQRDFVHLPVSAAVEHT